MNKAILIAVYFAVLLTQCLLQEATTTRFDGTDQPEIVKTQEATPKKILFYF